MRAASVLILVTPLLAGCGTWTTTYGPIDQYVYQRACPESYYQVASNLCYAPLRTFFDEPRK